MSEREPASLLLQGLESTVARQEVLRGIDLEVLPGELLVLLGAAGSGKSTLLRTIAGLDPASGGTVRLDGQDITQRKAHRRGVALLPQDYTLWPDMPVADNVAFALRGRRLARSEIRQRVDAELAAVGLADFGDHLPAQLGASQRQRVALARTLAAAARLYQFDEPFAAIEPALRERLASLFRQRQQRAGFTALLATQDRGTALRIADRIALIHDGELHQVDTPMALYDAPASRQVASYTGYANLIEGQIELSNEQAMFHGENGVLIPLFDDAVRRPRSCAAMFRPHELRMVAADEAPIGNEIRLKGRVEGREFLGELLRYRLDLAGTTAWMEVCRRERQMLLHVGDQIVLGLDPSHIRILDH